MDDCSSVGFLWSSPQRRCRDRWGLFFAHSVLSPDPCLPMWKLRRGQYAQSPRKFRGGKEHRVLPQVQSPHPKLLACPAPWKRLLLVHSVFPRPACYAGNLRGTETFRPPLPRPQQALPAGQLPERGLGWRCVHPRTARPQEQHVSSFHVEACPKTPQKEWPLGPDSLASSLPHPISSVPASAHLIGWLWGQDEWFMQGA